MGKFIAQMENLLLKMAIGMKAPSCKVKWKVKGLIPILKEN